VSGVFKKCWDEPKLHVFDNVQPAPPGTTAQLVEAPVSASNCDVYVEVPNAWRTNDGVGVQFVICARVAGTLHTLAAVFLSATSWEASGATETKALVFEVRGHPCDGFVLLMVSPPVTGIGVGKIRIRTWGDESTPEVTADGPFQGPQTSPNVSQVVIPKQAPPSRLAVMMAYDPVSGELALVESTANGGPSGGIVVAGTVTTAPKLSTAPVDLTGTAPDGSGGGNATVLGAPLALVQGIVISNDQDSPDDLYVSFAAIPIASAGVRLGPGDSEILLVSDVSKVFVNGGAAGVIWRAQALA
jgi:hypothetical protein